MTHDHLQLLTEAAKSLRHQDAMMRRMGELLRRATSEPGNEMPPFPTEQPDEDGPLALVTQLEDVAQLLRPEGVVS
jgi:hypothetical protein